MSLEQSVKMMPIMERSTTVAYVPWSLFTPSDEQQAQHNHDQSLDRLRERNGLSICELVAILDARPWRPMSLAAGWRRLWEIAERRRTAK